MKRNEQPPHFLPTPGSGENAELTEDLARQVQKDNPTPKVANVKIVDVGTTKQVLRPPFEKDGQWYYATKDLAGVETHGPFASKEQAVNDMAKAGK